MKNDNKTATQQSFEEFEKRKDESILEARIRYFFESWQPEDPHDISRFHGDFMMLVHAIYREASKNSEAVMMQLARNMPPFILEKKP